jgi:hypothetical protein
MKKTRVTANRKPKALFVQSFPFNLNIIRQGSAP